MSLSALPACVIAGAQRLRHIWREEGKAALSLWSLRLALRHFAASRAFERRAGRRGRRPDEWFDYACRAAAPFRLRPFQVRAEFLQLLHLVRERRPATMVEIGTGSGGSLFLFCAVLPDDATVISMDMPHGPFGGGYGSHRILLLHSFARRRQRVHLVRADSHAPATLERIRRLLEGRAVDFLFIDGDHTYEGVRTDFERYAPLVRPGGLIALHDIVEMPGRPEYGVARFWRELRGRFGGREIVEDPTRGGFGIGVIEAPEGVAHG